MSVWYVRSNSIIQKKTHPLLRRDLLANQENDLYGTQLLVLEDNYEV